MDDAGTAPGQQFFNPGPSCRANGGGSSSSIPYIDCSDVECDATRTGAAGGQSAADEPREYDGERVGKLFGVVNGFYHTNRQGRGTPGNASTASAVRKQTDGDVSLGGGSFRGRLPLHSTPLDEIKRPPGAGTLGGGGFHHRTNSFGGRAQSGSRRDDGRYYFSRVVPAEGPIVPLSSFAKKHYGSYSPIVSNRVLPRFADLYDDNASDRSDTDPFILSRLTSTPVHPRRAPCSTPLERRTGPRLYGKPSYNLNRPAQPIDGSTSSGTDSSDAESDDDAGGGGGGGSQPLVYGNPVAVGSMSSLGSGGGRLSFGALRLEEGHDGRGRVAEEDARNHFREGDIGGQIFSF